jgi:preprotein translocase subunit SecA
MGLWNSLFGAQHEKDIRAIEPLVKTIASFEPEFSKLTDDEIKGKTVEFRARLGNGVTLDELLPEAFALVREAGKRTLGQRHYDVQMMGGIVLHRKGIAEMRTGEGKTLVATLPAYLNALTGKGVHVVTVNDYLSRRDATWMGQIYAALGLSTAIINHDASFLYDGSKKEVEKGSEATLEMESFKVEYEFLRPCTRQEAYRADITYGTNSEFGFDYLRDNITYDVKDLRQWSHAYAIVDEIDSILIDEARTPLIISAPSTDSEKLYETFATIASKLEGPEHYTIDEKQKAIQLTDAGITRAEELLGIENIYTEKGIKYVHHLETATRAKALFIRDREYVIRNGEVVIVDEFTGRLQPGRRWSDGLHQAIEAKEGVEIQRESRTMASITYQNYFRMYEKLSGMTGTALTSGEEFLRIYGLDVIPVPPNRPSQRTDSGDQIYQTENGKFAAVARKVKELNQKGQPVLIGTVSIEKNELLSAYLTKEGVPHEVLNAKNHEREGEIIAQAGRKASVVIATNMAGRGVDIKLGGNPSTPEEFEVVKETGGLFVLGTERHEARRIDNQLRGRSGRQGDPGETQFFVSLDDSLMRVFASDTIKGMMGKFGIPEDQPIENRMISRALESAQEKIEGFHFDARKHVLQFDDVINHQRRTIYERRGKVLHGDHGTIAGLVAEYAEGNEELQKVIEGKVSAMGEKEFYAVMRRLILQTMDMYWIEHLELMDYARSSVNLRGWGQRDPLVEYKNEALRLYKELGESISARIVELIPMIDTGAFKSAEQEQKQVEKQMVYAGGGSETSGDAVPAQKIVKEDKVGRNDPCPCGSGKKWKKCGELGTEEHQRLSA